MNDGATRFGSSHLLARLRSTLEGRAPGGLELHVSAGFYSELSKALGLQHALRPELSSASWMGRTSFELQIHRTRLQVHVLGWSPWDPLMVSVLLREDDETKRWRGTIRSDAAVVQVEPGTREHVLAALIDRIPDSLSAVALRPALFRHDVVTRAGEREAGRLTVKSVGIDQVACISQDHRVFLLSPAALHRL